MAITIKDVAKQAEVSPATVSRVIADNPRISAKTKQKVRETMKSLGYYPNFQARNLVAQKTRTIGIIMANSTTLAFQNPFFPEVLRGISVSAHNSQYGLYLSTGATEEEIFEEVVAMDQGKRVDGIILLYSRVGDRIMDYLFQSGLPFSVVGRPHTNADAISYVDNDNIGIAKQVMAHLFGLGHQRIAFIAGGKDFVVTLDRLKGFEEALAEHAIPHQAEYVVNQEGMQQDGKGAIRQLFELPEPPTAIVTHDDLVAYEVIGYLEDLQINVPEDVSIIGFNNHALSKHLKPPLSSVDICIYELGVEAANLLLEKINDEKAVPRQITVSSRLIERGSCQGR
ncbi:LacI family DNA-binding transcriptional regulator [Planococcus sp. N028]|uniref:LacI family DNA-binding transcriptional regulator n=1 Tax=Planococcus shixiaomingii TaxID=3058393 RepID=A0ABT8N4U2_9BACL|nr:MULTISPECIES: LacI family DNA-binding transcriptional regulator [unclassified Planococcus (in: firmicutes)]MDN7242904.1 LacI family DNA-binding transcriptional regulator [Planococcus sp. N028]WKA55471.1 LacI family DNA-binding transcriptional regulator [Planococcus sp. N022]